MIDRFISLAIFFLLYIKIIYKWINIMIILDFCKYF